MTIDGTNITAYGLRLSTVLNHLSLPARKKILQEQGTTANDIKFEEYPITVVLFGTFATKTAISTMVFNMKTLLTSKLIHDLVISEHQINVKAVCKDGVKVEPFGLTAQLTIQFTVTYE